MFVHFLPTGLGNTGLSNAYGKRVMVVHAEREQGIWRTLSSSQGAKCPSLRCQRRSIPLAASDEFTIFSYYLYAMPGISAFQCGDAGSMVTTDLHRCFL